jgi:hypothetical protein
VRRSVGCGRPSGAAPGLAADDDLRLVSHLRWVEASWIERRLLGGAIDAPWTDDDPDRDFRIAVEVPLAQLLAEYRAACARHRDLVADLDLDTPSRGALGWRTERGQPGARRHAATSFPQTTPADGHCPSEG